MPDPLPAVSYAQSRCRVVHSWLYPEESELLDRAAARTGQHADRLVGNAVRNWLDGVRKSGVLD